MKRLNTFFIALIILGAFAVRLYRFNNPIADWHSWRQADTSAVSRNFVEHGFDVLHPRFEDISNVPSGLDNPMGYRFVEFPIYNVLQAGGLMLFGHFTLEEWGRLISIFSSLISSIFLYLIVKKHRDRFTAFLTLFFFALIPYNIYYSRTILPDTSMVTAVLGGIYFFDRWLKEGTELKVQRAKLKIKTQIFFILATVFTASSLLLKPYALFFTLPMIYLAFEKFGFSFLKKWQLWLFFIASALPLAFWRIWMLQYPAGIPVSSWLFNGGNIRFTGAFFYWIFANRLARLILGYWGVVFLVLGIIRKQGKEGLFFFSFLLSSLIYITVIARGNVQHDYYQILIMPSIAIYFGLGSEFLLKAPKEYFSKIICYLVFIVCFLFTFAFSWYFVRGYFNINNPSIVIAGQAVDKLIPQSAKILAPYGGDTSFLYQTKRQGWASFEKPLPEMVKMGADYLVLVNPTKNDYMIGKAYRIVSATPDYILFNLQEKP